MNSGGGLSSSLVACTERREETFVDLLSAWREMCWVVLVHLRIQKILSLTTANESLFKLFKWINQLAFVSGSRKQIRNVMFWISAYTDHEKPG